MKKLISVVLALAMILSLSAVAFAADTTTLYCAAPDGWTACYCYAWNNDGNNGWPGVAMTKGEDGIWYVDIDSASTNVIFNNGSGTQSADLTMPTDENVQFNYVAGSWSVYGAEVETPVIEFVTLYCNVADWGTPNAYWWGSAVQNSASWPGNAMTLVEGTVYSVSVPTDADAIIFNYDGAQTENLNLPTDGANMWDGSAWTTYTVSGGEEDEETEGNVVISDTVLVTDTWSGAGPYTWTAPSNGTLTVTFDEAACDQSWAYGVEGMYGMDLYWSDTVENGATYEIAAGETFTMIVFAYDGTMNFIEGTVSFEVTFSGESGEVVTPDTPAPGATQETAIDATNNAWHYIEAGATVWFMFDDSYDAMWNGVYSQMLNINSGAEYAVSYNEMEVPVDADGYVNYEMYSRNYSGVYYIAVTNLSEEKAFFTIAASDRPEYVNTYEYVYVGDNDITLDPSATYTLWEFEPTETGTYLITVPNTDALVGDWGATWYPQDKTENKTNTLEWTCTSVGQSLLIGVSVDAESTVMTIELKEEYTPDPVIEWIIWENIFEVTPYEGDGELVAIDVTDDIADEIYICEDGTMRYGSETGPIVVADLAGSIVNFLEAYGYGQLKVAYVDEDGEIFMKVDFNEALMEYYYAGVVYMNEELAAMLYDIGTNKGWYDPDVLGFYLWKDADGNITAEVDPESAWMFPCYYIEGTEITETPDDPETPETPETPENPEVNPGTSDYSVAGLVVAMMAATTGAVVIGKKKEF